MKIRFGDLILKDGKTIESVARFCLEPGSCDSCEYEHSVECNLVPSFVEEKKDFDRCMNYEVEIPQTVKHGRWEYDEKAIFIGCCRCSECGTRNYNLPTGVTDPYQFPGSSYCPHCGAKMGEKEEA